MNRRLITSGSPFEETFGCSRAVVVGDLIAVSGTAPIWPDGSCDPDVERQAERCLEIIAGALASAGSGIEDVIRTRIYLRSVDDWEVVAKVHGRVFGNARPANTTTVVAALVDPRWKLEIEADAMIGSERGAAASG